MQNVGHLVSRTNKDLQHYNVLVPRSRRLQSTFALDQLTGLAKHLCRTDFLPWIGFIFGFEVAPQTCERLRQALLNNSVPNPEIEIVPKSKLQDHDGAYDRMRQVILVSEELLDRVLEESDDVAVDASWELMIALVEEFGHHIDNLLRTVYSSIGGDAPQDEGAKYAFAIVNLDYSKTKRKHFADYTELNVKTELFVDYAHFHEAVQKYLSEEDRAQDDKSGDLEFFGSGRNRGPQNMSFGHESIEDSLEKAGFDKEERAKIYIGNWESDNSQVMVPLLVRGPKDVLFFKRDTFVKVVDVLCQLHFGENKFHVTRESLGVYWAEHHIDNPLGIEDGTGEDSDFPPKCTPAELGIDPVRSMKNYIATPGGWKTATGEVRKRIDLAIFHGRTDKGMRQYGRALHVIEDYYAHSNFVELTLRKLGYNVYPWVPIPAAGRPIVTTGCFGGLDAAATIMGAVGEILQRDDPFEPGKRTAGQRITLILLRERFPDIARYYEAFLKYGEKFKTEHPMIFRLLHDTVGQVSRWFLWLVGAAMRQIWDAIGTAQTLFDKNPNSTDPTHTQIAKDHDDHFFHVIAAQLASEAVRRISEVMILRWNWAPSQQGQIGIVKFPVAKYLLKDISPSERSNLDHWVHQIELRAREGDTVDLVGHASADGKEEFNLFLSQQRALTIEQYLRDHVSSNVKIKYTRSGVGTHGAAAHDPEWRRTDIGLSSNNQSPDPIAFANSFLVHPGDTNWMDKMVKEWAEANPNKLQAGASRNAYEHRFKKIKTEADKLIEKAGHSVENVVKWVEEAEKQFENFIFK